MKPQDLEPPFCFEERRLLVKDKILYVPPRLSEEQWSLFPGWEALQRSEGPLHIEYCSGHGHWVVERALQAPETTWVAIEKRFDRVQRIWAKRENHKINNLLIVCGEACCVTERLFRAEEVHRFYINFPDPWPKKRHAKHRLIQPRFLRAVARVARAGAVFTLVTDDVCTMENFLQSVCAMPSLYFTMPPPHYAQDLSDYGDSVFCSLWKREGRPIHYTEVQRV